MKPTQVVDPVVDAAKHPIRTTAWAVGLLRGIAATVIRVASGENGRSTEHETVHERSSASSPTTDAGGKSEAHEGLATQDVTEQDVVQPPPLVTPVEPAPQRSPEPPHESFANEPKAVSRASAHGRGGADAEIDDWYGEVEDPEPEGGGFVLEALAAGDTNESVQTGDLKAIISESETLRKAAELDKG